MVLSTQLFDRIVGISTSREPDRKATVLPVGCRKAPERRSATRIAFGQRTLICRDSGPHAGAWETVMLQDISIRGIGFLCPEPMPPGQTFMMKLTDREGETIRIRCVARRSERGGFGGTSFMIGAEFQQLIVHQPIRVTNENGDDAHDAHGEEIAPAVPSPTVDELTEPAPARQRSSAMSRAAACLLKAVAPSQWLRKDDDFSSVG